jgi:SNF2 family DNA or RNA helicase
MGGGKSVTTLTTVAAADLLDEAPVMVLAPRRVALGTWPDEARKWDHLKHLEISAAIGTVEQRKRALHKSAMIYTCNYDNLPWLVDFYGKDWPFRTVVADELTRLKNFRLRQGGSRARALGTVAHNNVERFIGLTGTPAANGYKDLWGQIWFLDRGHRLGRSYDSYMARWFRQLPGENRRGVELMPYSENEINERIKDICITIDPRDYGLDLAEPINTTVEVDLPPKARAHYRQMEKHFFTELGEHEIEAVHAGAKSQKLLQFTAGAVYTNPERTAWEVVHDEKIEALRSIVEEANGAPILVAYQHRSDLPRLLKAFPGSCELDNRKATEDAWNRGEIPMLLAHPQSAGHGLNLQHGGNIIVYFSLNWSLENHEQILERLGPLRQMQSGYDRPVYQYFIIAKNTIDEDVLERHASKRSVQSILLEAMKRRA